jgi:CIC family chloride channel protein
LVRCSDGRWYAATSTELRELLRGAEVDLFTARQTLEQLLGAERTPVLFPDLPLDAALPHFRRWPLLPVTNRAVRGAPEGTVSLEDVLGRYQQN